MSNSNILLSTPLKASEVEFRVQSIAPWGDATLLVYKNARVDMARLDAVYGAGNWQRKHELIDGHLFCSIGTWHELSNQWVWIQDVGTESNAEATKGEASDSFKRAGFNLGIGRELYDYPEIKIKLIGDGNKNKGDEWFKDGNKGKALYALQLKKWRWCNEFNEAGKLTYLAAKDYSGTIRFTYGKRQEVSK